MAWAQAKSMVCPAWLSSAVSMAEVSESDVEEEIGCPTCPEQGGWVGSPGGRASPWAAAAFPPGSCAHAPGSDALHQIPCSIFSTRGRSIALVRWGTGYEAWYQQRNVNPAPDALHRASCPSSSMVEWLEPVLPGRWGTGCDAWY